MDVKAALSDLSRQIDKILSTVPELRRDLEGQINAVRDSLERFTRQLPSMGKSSSGRDPDYGGFWPNEKAAADFGYLVLGLVHPDGAKREECAEKIAKGGYTLRSANGQFATGENFVKAMGISGDTAGGYLVPDEFASTIIRNVNQFGVLRKYITRVPMSRERQSWPKRNTGLTVYYPDEGQSATASDLTLGKVTLTAKKWAVLTFFSKELEEDAVIGLGELLAAEIALALAIAEDTNGFMGDGGSTYGGVLGVFNSLNVAVVTMGSGDTAFSNLAHTDLIDLKAAVPGWVRQMPDCGYYMHPEIVALCEKMVDANGRPMYNQPTEGHPLKIGGYPVREVNVLPDSTDSGASKKFLAFGSLKAWGFLGERRSLQIGRSDEIKFLEDQVAIKAVPRQDIQEQDGEAMAVLSTAAA